VKSFWINVFLTPFFLCICRFDERDRSGREQREQYSRRDEHRPVYREERSREQRPQRDERVVVRDPARVTARHETRSEWKSERGKTKP